MSIQQTPAGKYRAVYRDQDGKVRSSPVFDARSEAEQWQDDHAPGRQRLNLSDLVDRWAEAQNHSPHAREVQAALAALFADRQWTRPGQVTVAEIERWNTAAGGRGIRVAGRGVTRRLQYLLTVLRWAHDRLGTSVDHRVLRMRNIKPERKPKPPLLSADLVAQIRVLAASYGPRAAAVVDYLMTYAARPITACRLTRAHLDCSIDPPELTIPIAKHSGSWKHKVLPEHAEAWANLHRPDGQDAPLFPHVTEDRPWRITNGKAAELKDWYRRAIAKPLGLTPEVQGIYNLKRYAMTRLWQAFGDPIQIARISGHKTETMPLRYMTSSDDDQIAGLMRLSRGPD